jgi:hypothetical protein
LLLLILDPIVDVWVKSMTEDSGPGVKSKANTRLVERIAKLPHRRGLGKVSLSIAEV